MRRYVTLSTLAMCLVSTLATASEPDSAGSPASSRPASTPRPIIDANSLDPGRPLSAARDLFFQFEIRAAAAKIRQGASEVRTAARDAATDAKQSLNATADELETLSQRVEAGSIKTVEELDRPFARAYHSLAQHHYLAGQRLWRAREHQLAGRRLRVAADNLERAAAAAGHRLSSTADAAVRESRLLSEKLIEGAGYATDDVGKTFESLGKQVETVGQNVEPVALTKPATRS